MKKVYQPIRNQEGAFKSTWFPFCLLMLGVLLAGCAQYHVNDRLERLDRSSGYRPSAGTLKSGALKSKKGMAKENSVTLLVALAFSGGGTRAAALSYGVLEELRRTEIVWEGKNRRLLDEVDSISSVSGGSFTAAYYGLFRDRIFEDFEKKFLKRNVQGDLFARLFSPVGWFRLVSEGYDRADLAADFYDEILFEKKTFGDLAAKGRPIIQMNATDMSFGNAFTFTQDYFDLICSDLASYPVSRAVTASSAFPVAFTPITLRNYAGSCGHKMPGWVQKELNERDGFSRRFSLAKTFGQYKDAKRIQYIHLLDGGISDNLGLRTSQRIVTSAGDPWAYIKNRGFAGIRRLLIIVVDSKSSPPRDWSQLPRVSGVVQMLDASTSAQVDRFSLETLVTMRRQTKEWVEEVRQKRCQELPGKGCDELKFDMIHLTFDSLKDKAKREFFLSVPTALGLPEETVDRIRAVAGKLMKESGDYQRVLRELNGKVLDSPASPKN